MSDSVADNLVAENDPDLTIGGFTTDRFEPGFFRIIGVEPGHIRFEFAHEEEHSHDHEGPQDQHDEEEHLIASHPSNPLTR